MMTLALLLLLTFLVNLPMGYWREGVRKFSPAWFVAVHAAVPVVIAARFALGIEFAWVTLPFMVAAYFAGQATGARLRRRRARRRLRGLTGAQPGAGDLDPAAPPSDS